MVPVYCSEYLISVKFILDQSIRYRRWVWYWNDLISDWKAQYRIPAIWSPKLMPIYAFWPAVIMATSKSVTIWPPIFSSTLHIRCHNLLLSFISKLYVRTACHGHFKNAIYGGCSRKFFIRITLCRYHQRPGNCWRYLFGVHLGQFCLGQTTVRQRAG